MADKKDDIRRTDVNERDFTDNVVEKYQTYDELVANILQSGKEYDMAQIEKAYLFANKAHAGQKRKSGEPYIVHPVSVANILVSLGMDTESVVAALLHDVVEDTPVTLEDIRKTFGDTTAQIIDGLTKLSKLGFNTEEEHQAENVRRMLMATNKDIRVLIIKLADRLNNMRTLSAMYPQKQRNIARETMEIYAPLAHRMGIRQVKEELEDLSLRYLDPIGYKQICERLAAQQSDRQAFLESIKEELRQKLLPHIPNVTVSGRVKSVNGIYHKMIVQGKSFGDIYDVYAVRVIVDTVEECYTALGWVQTTYTPLPGRFKDYIATPKSNGYMSLHTTVMKKNDNPDENAVPFEVQIRTRDMHRTAEYGVAAHWKYKTGEAAENGKRVFENTVSWIRQMIEDQMDSDVDVITVIKDDLMPEEIYVFTPKGDLKVLPVGSTVIDFAYAIHSEVGHRMIGAKIDGKIVPLNTKLRTGNVVEIQTTREITNGPSRDWLSIATTSQAKNKIRSWFKNERRAENIEEGKAEFEREMKRAGLVIPEDKFDEFMQEQIRKSHKDSVDDFYAAIGYGGIVMTKLMARLREDYARIVTRPSAQPGMDGAYATPARSRSGGDTGVRVKGIENCQIKMSRCCNPLPGDEIIGFITRGFGVSIHKRNCSNVPQDLEHCENPERWIEAYWSESTNYHEFKTTLRMTCMDRKGLLADVTMQLSMMHIGISMLNSREMRDGNAVITVTISVSSKEHLAQITSKLSRISGVLSIE